MGALNWDAAQYRTECYIDGRYTEASATYLPHITADDGKPWQASVYIGITCGGDVPETWHASADEAKAAVLASVQERIAEAGAA